MTAKQSAKAGWLYGVLAQSFWGSSSVVINLISKTLPVTLLVAIRHGIGAIFLGSTILAGRRKVFINTPWGHLILFGILAGGLPDLLLTTSVRHAGPIVAVMLARLEIPLGVLFAHIFLKERVTRRTYFASLLGIIGAGFISYKPGEAISLHNGFYLGVAAGMAAGLAWGLATIYGKFILNRQIDSLAVTFVRLSIGSISSLVLAVILVRHPLSILWHLSSSDWLKIVYLGLFSSGVGYLLFYRSLSLIDASIAQILLGVSMVVTVFLGLVVGVSVTTWQWLGITTIAWSIYLIKATSDKSQSKLTVPPDD